MVPAVLPSTPRESRRSTARKLLVLGSTIAAVVGAGMLAYPPFTDLWAARVQHGLAREFDALAGELATSAGPYARRAVERGHALTRLEIPRLQVNVVVVEGTTTDALRAGAGHYEDTPFPGERGNVAVAGHRTTYGRPFNRLDEIVPGDRIILTTPIDRHTYRVIAAPWTVFASDWSPVHDYPDAGAFLTLTSCEPEGSDSHRIVVRALLFRSQPFN